MEIKDASNNNKAKTKSIIKGLLKSLINSLWLLGIQVIFSFFSMIMTVDNENPMEFVRVLSIIMTLSVLTIIFFISKSSAYSDFQIYKNNFIRQSKGDAVPVENIIRQYRWYNALIYSFAAALPSIVLAVICIAKGGITQGNWAGVTVTLINYVYLVPLFNYGVANNAYLIFIGAFILMGVYSTGYILNGEKLKTQYFSLIKYKGHK